MEASQVEAVARRLSQLAGSVRDIGGRLGAGTDVRWESLAAQRFRDGLEEEAGRVRQAASLLDEAAQAVRDHAVAVAGRPG